MIYLKVTEGRDPRMIAVSEIKTYCDSHSLEVSFDLDFLATIDVYPLIQRPRPQINEITQLARYGEIHQDSDGRWIRDWIIEDLSEEASRHNAIKKRNELYEKHITSVSAIDFQLLSDEDKETLTTYAADLKNIHDREGFPMSFTWPSEPFISDLQLLD